MRGKIRECPHLSGDLLGPPRLLWLAGSDERQLIDRGRGAREAMRAEAPGGDAGGSVIGVQIWHVENRLPLKDIGVGDRIAAVDQSHIAVRCGALDVMTRSHSFSH